MTNSRAFYTPGTDTIDLSRPGGVEALLALHRSLFGGFHMVDGDNGAGDAQGTQGAGQPEAPTVNEHGFPDKTPVKDMTDTQQAAYWRHQARKHEDRVKSMGDYDALKAERDELKSKTQTADEKALEAAKKEALEAGASAERAKIAPRLVSAEFKSAAAGRFSPEQFALMVDGIDPSKFLTAEGEVDADKVKQYVDGLAPADGKKWPATGQGNRQQQKTTGVSAGRALFDSRQPRK